VHAPGFVATLIMRLIVNVEGYIKAELPGVSSSCLPACYDLIARGNAEY